MACYIVCLLITLTTSTFFSQGPGAHFTVVDKNSSQDDPSQRYRPYKDPFASHVIHKMQDDIAYNRALQEQENQRELLAEQALIWQYKQQGIDLIWASRAACNVAIRCTVINFLNGGMLSRQLLPPSPLPNDFHENFEGISLFEWLTAWNRDRSDYQQQWYELLSSRVSSQVERQCYEHAEMRRWNQYRYPEFHEFIKELSVYDNYMLEIAAQYEHDSVFAQRLNHAAERLERFLQRCSTEYPGKEGSRSTACQKNSRI